MKADNCRFQGSNAVTCRRHSDAGSVSLNLEHGLDSAIRCPSDASCKAVAMQGAGDGLFQRCWRGRVSLTKGTSECVLDEGWRVGMNAAVIYEKEVGSVVRH